MLEQHPIPQNVTNFQFRLIGDMTLKQFGYLAGGAILAYISYNLPLPFFFTYPLTGLFVLGGIGFAFVPVEERPMDVWFLSFIKSIYSPTQYLWQRELNTTTASNTATASSRASVSPIDMVMSSIQSLLPKPKPKTAGQTIQPVKQNAPVQPPVQQHNIAHPAPPQQKAVQHPIPVQQTQHVQRQQPFSNTHTIVQPAYATIPRPTILASTPLPPVSTTHVSVQHDQKPVVSQPPQIQTQQQTPPSPIPSSPPSPVSQQSHPMPQQPSFEQRLKMLEEQLEKERMEKQNMEQEMIRLKQQMQNQQHIPTKQASVILPAGKSETVKVISPQAAKTAGMPSLSKLPNVVSGIVKEPNGNLLVGILVTVKDKDDIPVRALKTNKLGQFAASTPLANGEYTIEAEDPKRTLLFDLVKVTLTGAVIPPVELIAKTPKQLERQKLEQALFGSTIPNKPGGQQ